MKSNIKSMPLESIPKIGNNIRNYVKFWGWSKNLLLFLLLLLLLLLFILLLLWRYNSTWALASSILHLQTSLSSGEILHFLHFNVLLAFLSTSSSHLPLGLPTDFLPSTYPFSASRGTFSSCIFLIWMAHWSLRNLIFLVSSNSLYKL